MIVNGPFNITAVCVTWTRTAAGSVNRTYDLVFYDTLGAGGAPGNIIAIRTGVTANGVAIFPAHSRHRHDIAPVTVNGRACYVGVRLNNNPPQSVYISADETGTMQGPGYERSGPGFPATWVLIPPGIGGFPNWKNFGIRLEGTAGGGGNLVNTLCRGGLNIVLNDHTTIRDSVQFVSNNACIVRDVNLRIDTLTHTWDADVRAYLRHGATGVIAVNWVGGSGDNFINTVLNDSAATPIASGVAPFTGSFRPSNPFTPFNGGTAAGFWTLVLTDTATADTGQLRRWCVVIEYDGCVGGIQTVEIPNYYSLNQNYPNPFNPSTTIKFGLPKGENVKLVVYDLLGREVKTLINEFRASGTHEVNFDASALSSGVYFYKLVTPNFTETKRMLLVK
jgi:subtilisin-like proprotein convertase family protein